MMITRRTSSRRGQGTGVFSSLHNECVVALECPAANPLRVTGDAIHADEFWRPIDESVRSDGTIDTSLLAHHDAGGVLY